MINKELVSKSVIKRLPRYYRYLTYMANSGVKKISSKDLAQKMGVTASQIRQDLNCFGGFGQQGYGYNISELRDQIGDILGVSNQYKAILIGAGKLGGTVASHLVFDNLGFELCAIFDSNEHVIGNIISGKTVMHIKDIETFCENNTPNAAILCIPREQAKDVVSKLYSLGIKNYWNFSHYDISMYYKDTIVENVHLNDSLMTLCYMINNA